MFTWLPFYEKSLKYHLKISSKWPTLSTKALHYVAHIHYIHSILFGGLVKSSGVAPHYIGLKYIKRAQFFIDDKFWEEMTCEWALLGVLCLIKRLIVQGFLNLVYFTNCSTSAMHVHSLCTVCHESILVRLSYFLFFSFSFRNSQVIRIGLCSAWEILMFSIIKKKRGTSFVSFCSFYQNWDKSQCERVLAKYFSWKC